MKIKNLKEAINYLYKINENNPKRYYGEYKSDMLEYNIMEGQESLEWYKAILEKAKKYNPKRVIDIGSNLNMFGYLFANEGIEYIGIDVEKDVEPIQTDKIKFIHANYYDVRDWFEDDDIFISCLCVGYLIPVKDVKGKVLIVNDHIGTNETFKCTAKEIDIRRN